MCYTKAKSNVKKSNLLNKMKLYQELTLIILLKVFLYQF